jgi:hypothetical protein
VQTKCCEEWLACGDDVNCSQKSTSEPGEIICIQSCLIDAIAESGIADLQECARVCSENSAGVSAATSDLIACMRSEDANGRQACSTPCFGADL